ncbi:hypothetical protein, partial [Leptotrichia hongkongensis]
KGFSLMWFGRFTLYQKPFFFCICLSHMYYLTTFFKNFFIFSKNFCDIEINIINSEFFVSAEKCRRLAISYCIAILPNILIIRINLYCKIRFCGNEQSYENKNEKIFINQNI